MENFFNNSRKRQKHTPWVNPTQKMNLGLDSIHTHTDSGKQIPTKNMLADFEFCAGRGQLVVKFNDGTILLQNDLTGSNNIRHESCHPQDVKIIEAAQRLQQADEVRVAINVPYFENYCGKKGRYIGCSCAANFTKDSPHQEFKCEDCEFGCTNLVNVTADVEALFYPTLFPTALPTPFPTTDPTESPTTEPTALTVFNTANMFLGELCVGNYETVSIEWHPDSGDITATGTGFPTGGFCYSHLNQYSWKLPNSTLYDYVVVAISGTSKCLPFGCKCDYNSRDQVGGHTCGQCDLHCPDKKGWAEFLATTISVTAYPKAIESLQFIPNNSGSSYSSMQSFCWFLALLAIFTIILTIVRRKIDGVKGLYNQLHDDETVYEKCLFVAASV
jgi:hypothetical protein